MEQDIIQLADDFLERIFQDKLNESDKLALEHWLRTQLEKERGCWKDKIKLSFDEVEKERKLALDAHTAVHDVSDQIEAIMDQYGVEIEEGYAAAESDYKRNHVSTMERNVGTILHGISNAVKDRRACLQYLGYDIDAQIAVFPILVSSVDELKMKIQDTRTDFNIREEDLRRDMVRLHEELAVTRSKYQALLDEIAVAKDQNPSTASDDDDAAKCSKCGMDTTIIDNECGDDLEPKPDLIDTEEVGIQVDAVNTPALLADACTQTSDYKEAHPLEDILEIDHEIITSRSDLLKSPKFEPKSGSSSSGGSDSGRTNLSLSLSTPTNALRPQVRPLPIAPGLLGEACPLSLSHSQGEHRLASLQKACSEGSLHTVQSVKSHRRGRYRTPRGGTHEHEGYADGYLSGVRKEIINTQASLSYGVQTMKQITWRKSGDNKGVYHAGNRCLRCHKLYSVKDNHRMACRYHQKGKRKLEKYDARGRLQMVTYIWECCMQRPEAMGCSTGEHV